MKSKSPAFWEYSNFKKKIELTDKEKEHIKNKGFFARDEIPFKKVLINIPFILLSPVISVGIMFFPLLFIALLARSALDIFGIDSEQQDFLAYIFFSLSLFPWMYSTLKIFYDYIYCGKEFFSQKGKIIRRIHGKKGNYFSLGVDLFSYILGIKEFLKSPGGPILNIFILCLLILPGLTIVLLPIYYYPIEAIYITLGLFIIFLIAFFLRSFIELFHPLYAFGNLGEKIQKLTPRIKEQSQKIQSEFQSDMNFSVLSNGFDSLSTTFTDIVTLVIKLEKVEARANKGNLFDSEKYINSLRSDIVTPLTSLKVFLEKQKSELMNSQKELTRVRVGGSEGTGNIELQSKRSESLIIELTENIEKLDVMIGKMG